MFWNINRNVVKKTPEISLYLKMLFEDTVIIIIKKTSNSVSDKKRCENIGDIVGKGYNF